MSQLYEAHNDIVSLLPVKIYRHNLEGNYIYSPLHFHRSIELTVTLTGNIRFNSGLTAVNFIPADTLHLLIVLPESVFYFLCPLSKNGSEKICFFTIRVILH